MEQGITSKEDLWERGGLTLKRHFQASTKKMRRMALGSSGYDPARLYRWGQMMALAVVRMMESAERNLGEEAQRPLSEALVELGRQIGREVLEGFSLKAGTSEIQAISAFVTYVNEEIWASPEVPEIVDDNVRFCDVIWCPHQDHYRAFDCRVQRYIVQGLLEAWEETTGMAVDVHFTQVMPKGAPTCRFEIRKIGKGEPRKWSLYSQELAKRALERAGSAGRISVHQR